MKFETMSGLGELLQLWRPTGQPLDADALIGVSVTKSFGDVQPPCTGSGSISARAAAPGTPDDRQGKRLPDTCRRPAPASSAAMTLTLTPWSGSMRL
jgi:hypothetical protein